MAIRTLFFDVVVKDINDIRGLSDLIGTSLKQESNRIWVDYSFAYQFNDEAKLEDIWQLLLTMHEQKKFRAGHARKLVSMPGRKCHLAGVSIIEHGFCIPTKPY